MALPSLITTTPPLNTPPHLSKHPKRLFSNYGNLDYMRKSCRSIRSTPREPVLGLSSINHTTVERPVCTFPPAIWKDHIYSFSLDEMDLESHNRRVEILKKEVEAMILASFSGEDDIEMLKLIDLLCRLGISYHFQTQIEEKVDENFHKSHLNQLLNNKDLDLHTTAVVFRVFRQHGFEVPSDIFKRFKNVDNGEIEEYLAKDPKGILSLFEAAHLSIHGEDILDEALAFSTTHLERLVVQCEQHLANQISSALNVPLHKGMPWLKAREFITYYSQEDDKNDLLLKFASSDFNRVQLLHSRELQSLFGWWKKLDLGSKLPFGRDRIMEMYFWAACEYYEPSYAYARKAYAKIVYLLTYLDDTYDAYGTYDELAVLTDAIQRWDRDVLGELPVDYMKHLLKAWLDLFDELDHYAAVEGRSYCVSITIDLVKELARGYLKQCEWAKDGHTPSFLESMDEAAWKTGGAELMGALSFIGMGDVANLEAYAWLSSGHSFVRALGVILRLIDDIVTYKEEKIRGYEGCPLFGYMKQNKVSEKEAVDEFRRRISSSWKTMNEYWLRRPSTVPKEVMLRLINLARTAHTNYSRGDGLSYPKIVEDDVKAMLVDPLLINGDKA